MYPVSKGKALHEALQMREMTRNIAYEKRKVQT